MAVTKTDRYEQEFMSNHGKTKRATLQKRNVN